MKIVVVFKWSKDPQYARIGRDGSVDWQGAKMAAGDDDPLCMEIARGIVGDGEIVGLTIGDGDKAWAAARGAARTVLIPDAQTETSGSVTGAILAAAIRRIGDVDAVIIGDSIWDYSVVSALAGQLGWPAVAGVASAEKTAAGLRVRRKMGNLFQIIDVEGPTVIAASANCSEQDPPSMKAVLAARKKPVEQIKVADLGLETTAEVNSKGTRLPDKAPAQIIDGSDPVAASKQLLTLLQANGVL